MRVLVFEPKYVGHFLGFAAMSANAFARLGCQVTLLYPREAEGSDQAKIKLALVDDSIDVRFVIDVPKLYDQWKNAEYETRALAKALDEFPTDQLVLPSGDFVLVGLLKKHRLRRRLKQLGGVDLIIHSCPQVYPTMGIRRRATLLAERLAVSFARGIRLHTVDPFATSSASVSHMGIIGNPVRPLPHFLEGPAHPPSRTAARSTLGLPAEAKLLGSVGDLGRRKGTELLVESFARSQPPAGCHLVLFGLLSASAKKKLNEHQSLVESGHIILQDRFVTDEEFDAFFFAMDAVWAGFPRQVGVASTMLYAAVARCPVIATDYGAVGWMTDRYGLGKAYPATIPAITEAIKQFQKLDGLQIDPERLQRLLEYHTTENFEEHLTRAVRERLATERRSTGEITAEV